MLPVEEGFYWARLKPLMFAPNYDYEVVKVEYRGTKLFVYDTFEGCSEDALTVDHYEGWVGPLKPPNEEIFVDDAD